MTDRTSFSGKYVNHKGRSRHFTSAEELEEERKKNALKKQQQGSDSSSEEEAEEEGAKGSDSEEESSEDDDTGKAKGVSGLIEIENPNRVQKKAAVKIGQVAALPKPELSRKEREEIEKQQAAARYQKMHAEGKTEEARADLARLAIIKQHRLEAAARREKDKKERDEKAAAASKK